MKRIITFFEHRNSLLVSLCFILLGILGVFPLNAQAPYFGQRYYKVVQSFSNGDWASGQDVIFSNSCSPEIYLLGNESICGMGCTHRDGEVRKINNSGVISYYYPSSSPIGYPAGIKNLSINANGFVSYSGDTPSSWMYDNYSPYYIALTDLLVSSTNDTYACGTFTDSTWLDLFGTIILHANGANGFLVKYSTGSPIWGIVLPNMTPRQMVNLSNGTFIVMGTFTGTSTLNGHTISTITGGNMFWAKFLPDGICIALTQINSGTCTPVAMRKTPNGNLYVTGTHSNGAIVAGTSLNGTGAFTAKYDSLGLELSAVHIGNTNVTSYGDMDVDVNGNTYLLKSNYHDVYKYNLNNVLLWQLSANAYTAYYGNMTRINGIGVDDNGQNIGVAGHYAPYEGYTFGGSGVVNDSNYIQGPIYIGFYALALQPAITLTSTTPTICTNGAATITLNAGAGTSNYTWQQSTNGGASWYSVSGANSSTTSIVATLTATRLFRVIYSNACGLDTTPVFTLTVVPDPTVTLSASNNNFCAGTSGTTLTATLNGGIGTGIYQWQQYIGSVWTNIAGATNASYTTPTLSANTNYKVISSQTGLGCVTTGPNTINIIVLPLPSIYTNPASSTICTGGSVTVNAYNGTSYSWSPPTGLNTTTGSPVIASPTVSTTYSLTGTGTNGCSKTISVPITVNLDPSVSITGDTTVCSGGSLTLTSVSGGGAGTCTCQWQTSANGTTWSNIAGATTATYTTPALTATTYYRVTYSCSGSGCSPAAFSNSHKIHIFNNVLTSVGSTTVCVGATVKLLAPVMGGTYQCSWTWESSPNGSTWTTIPNANLTYYYAPTNTAGNTYYRANTNCVGAVCTNTPTPGMLVSVIADPSVTITGQNSICGSGSTVLTANPLGEQVLIRINGKKILLVYIPILQGLRLPLILLPFYLLILLIKSFPVKRV